MKLKTLKVIQNDHLTKQQEMCCNSLFLSLKFYYRLLSY
jgi:hypothetical protein